MDKLQNRDVYRQELDALCDEYLRLPMEEIQRRLDERIEELAAVGWSASDLRQLREGIAFILAPLPPNLVIRIPILPGQGFKCLAAWGWPPTTL